MYENLYPACMIVIWRRGRPMMSRNLSTQKDGKRKSVYITSLLLSTNRFQETAAQMIRQRVDIRGRVRNMEPQDQVEALKVQPGQVGIIKQAPALRWAKGQDAWDVEFKASAERVIKRRKKLEAKYQTILEHAREKGLVLKDEYTPPGHERAPTSSSNEGKDGTIQEDRRWGPLDLDDENPPPSSIVKRRDTVSLHIVSC